jgi:hypothetical protein
MPPRLIALAAAVVAALVAAALILAPADHPATPRAATAAAKPAAFHPAATARAVRTRRARAARALGAAGVVSTDRRTGGVRFAGRLDGFLTGRSNRDAAKVALGYVRRHREVFGLDRGDLGQLELADRQSSHGMTLLRWTQRSGGVPLLEGSLRAAVTDDGRLVNVTGGARHDLPRPGTPKLDAEAAKTSAARATGGTAKDAQTALVFTAATGDIRLAWRVLRPQGTAYYDQLIDATTGEEISRRDRMDHAVPGLVYDTYPGAPIGGTPRTMDLAPYLDPGASDLSGPRARVWPDFNGNDVQEAGERITKTATGDFKYFRNAYHVDPECPAAGCAWTPRLASSWSSNTKQAGVQLFSLLAQFGDHLAAPPIGFDGFHTGFEQVDNDPVIGNVMDGATTGANGLPDDNHVNNAQM